MNDKKELYTLLHHLRNCPADFTTIDLITSDGKLITEALLFDMFRSVHGDFNVPSEKLPTFKDVLWKLGENELRAIQIGTWFFSNEIFKSKPSLVQMIRSFLLDRLLELCEHVKYPQFLDDEDRAEEFVREALNHCDILIDGETKPEAHDRLDALSTIKRAKVLRDTSESLERMKAIRQKMAEQKAREAANVYGRE